MALLMAPWLAAPALGGPPGALLPLADPGASPPAARLETQLEQPGVFPPVQVAGAALRAAVVGHGEGPGAREAALAAAQARGALVLHAFRGIPALGVLAAPAALRALPLDPGVAAVELVPGFVPALDVSARAMRARSAPGDPGAEGLGLCGRGAVIAVLDTGVDEAHASLRGKFVAGADVSLTMPLALLPPLHEGNPGDDNAATLPFDPVQAVDAMAAAAIAGSVRVPSASAFVAVSHGTHVAGTALGTGGATGAMRGVAPCARLVDVKVLTGSGVAAAWPPNGLVPNPFGVMAGLDWVLDYNAGRTRWGLPGEARVDIVNLSVTALCGDTTSDWHETPLDRLVDAVVRSGVVVVAAAGNCGVAGVRTPGTAALAITVGAVNDQGTVARGDDGLADFSSRPNFGQLQRGLQKPDVLAPGVSVRAPRAALAGLAAGPLVPAPVPLAGEALQYLARGLGAYEQAIAAEAGTSPWAPVAAQDGYHDLSGTSMAAPHVAGLAALLLEADPHLDPSQVKDRILAGAGGAAWSPLLGWGSADARAAAVLARGGSGQPPDVGVVEPRQGPGAWSPCSGNLRVAAQANSGHLVRVTLQVGGGPVRDVLPAMESGYYQEPFPPGLATVVRVVARNSWGHERSEEADVNACLGSLPPGPERWTRPGDGLLAYLAPGGTAALAGPDGSVMTVTFRGPRGASHGAALLPLLPAAVVALDVTGAVAARASADPGLDLPEAWFEVRGAPMVGAALDGTWMLVPGLRWGSALPAGMQVRLGGLVFDDDAAGAPCLGLATGDRRPIDAGGSGAYAGDPFRHAKTWNWHLQHEAQRPRYDTRCPDHGPGGNTMPWRSPEENPEHARFFPPRPV